MILANPQHPCFSPLRERSRTQKEFHWSLGIPHHLPIISYQIPYFFTLLPVHFTSFLILSSVFSHKLYAEIREEKKKKWEEDLAKTFCILTKPEFAAHALKWWEKKREMRGKETDRAAEIWKKKRRWERMREDVEFCPLENVRSYLRISKKILQGRC